jgi:hypothetical protein
MEKSTKSWVLPLAVLYVLVDLALYPLQSFFATHKVNTMVVLGANTVLFAATVLNIVFQEKNLNNPNPAAVIRGVMAGTFLKLFALAATAMIYLLAAGVNRSVNAVFIGMGLYILYTWLEVRITLRMKPKK